MSQEPVSFFSNRARTTKPTTNIEQFSTLSPWPLWSQSKQPVYLCIVFLQKNRCSYRLRSSALVHSGIFFFRGAPRTLTCSRTEPLVFLGTKTLTTYCNNCFYVGVPCGGSHEVLYNVTDKLDSQKAVKRPHRAEGPSYNFKRWLSSWLFETFLYSGSDIPS